MLLGHYDSPVAVTALPGASVATRAWKQRGQLYVTVVVKSAFALNPGGVMTPLAPEPIEPDERQNPAGPGLVSGGDLAPYLPQTDLWLIGYAQGTPPPGESSIDVHIALARDSAYIYEKALSFEVDTPPGQAASAPLIGMGPVSSSWPIRAHYLGDYDPARLQGPRIELPDALDWAYFQTAPLDQRLPPLRGNEWLLLEGIDHEQPHIETYLPGARALAKLFGHEGALRQGRPLRIGLDSLHINAEKRACTLLWRGYFPVSDEKLLRSFHIVGGLELPGKELVWPDPFESRPTQSSSRPPPLKPPSAPPENPRPLEGTFALSEADEQKLASLHTLPFAHPKNPPPKPPSAPPPNVPSALPFKPPSAPPPKVPSPLPLKPPSAPPPPKPLLPLSSPPYAKSPLESTNMLSEADEATLAALAAVSAVPFKPQKTPAKAPAPPATRSKDPPAAPAGKLLLSLEAPPPDHGMLGGTLALSEEDEKKLAAVAVLPFIPTGTPHDPKHANAGLGAIFLAAMAEAIAHDPHAPGMPSLPR